MSEERRKVRSQFKDVAMQAWLDAVAERARVPAIVVADEAGLLVGSGVQGEDAQEMAAMAARRAQPGDQEVTVTDASGAGLVIRSFVFSEEVLYVCARGQADRLESCRTGVEEAIQGVSRILVRP